MAATQSRTSSRRVSSYKRVELSLGRAIALLVIVASLALPDCRRSEPDHALSTTTTIAPQAESDVDRSLAALRQIETTRRAATDFENQPRFDQASGSNPYRIAAHPDGVLIGLLRGATRLTVLDAKLNEVSSADTLTSPVALTVSPAGDIFVSSDLQSSLDQFRLQDGKLEHVRRYPLTNNARFKDLASGSGSLLYALDEETDELVVLNTGGRTIDTLQKLPVPKGVLSVTWLKDHLLVDCLLDHSLTVYSLDHSGAVVTPSVARIRHDGPIWSVAGLPTPDGLLLALGGVEDHPLDRTIGSFGYIDSFVYLYRITGEAVVKLAAINLSEHGLLTPKTLLAEPNDDGFKLEITGYGGRNAATLTFRAPADLVSLETWALPPGTAAVATIGEHHFYADPLLDAWVEEDRHVTRVVPIDGDRATPADASSVHAVSVEDAGNPKLGEALLFTYLMAPANPATGPRSRFTCETCHFEGNFDGRVHYTGRADVHAATKPLFGLFNNLPYFSRALDRDLTQVVHNEFRVAGAGSGTDPWFDLDLGDHPWLQYLGVHQRTISASALRASLLAFLMEFNPAPNPHSFERTDFSTDERLGSAVFETRCESCHQARLVTNQAASRVPAARWPELIFRKNSPLVWATDEYRMTGVTPYVHEQGARVPSLRRVYKKYPYFTNGSAKTLNEVLDQARFDDSAFFHANAPTSAALSALNPNEKRELLAFLELL